MNVFDLRDKVIRDYAEYVRAFIQIRDPRIKAHVEQIFTEGALWPDPLIQLNPNFESGGTIDDLVKEGALHAECKRIFRIKKSSEDPGRPLRLHRHQTEAIRIAKSGRSFVLTSGTGSGKSLTYIIPAVDHVLRRGSGQGIQAIVIYPMNALANSQLGELKKFVNYGYPGEKGPVTFGRYTGQESEEDKEKILNAPPDILLTNYVMMELILTRPKDAVIVRAAKGLQFVVLDELHSYRGRQGADVSMLVRRLREACGADRLQCIGTSATIGGEGGLDQQRIRVSEVATRLFGTSIEPSCVVQETIRRATPDRDPSDAGFLQDLKARVIDATRQPPRTHKEFIQDPLSIWLESAFGIAKDRPTGRLIRAKPREITGKDGAAAALATVTGITSERCVQAVRDGLLGGYQCEPDPESGFPVFAFRLNQFISRGDTVYASPEDEESRHMTVHGQKFVPGSRDRVLLPLVFCRECGQEYYCVRRSKPDGLGSRVYEGREISDRLSKNGGDAGFLYISTEYPFPIDQAQVADRVPEDWIEETAGGPRVVYARRKDLPETVSLGPDGRENQTGQQAHFISAPFRFCLRCGVSYGGKQSSDYSKLATLSSEGRSTATTILALSMILRLKQEQSIAERARKLLSFTDNRQDASLQAGHFNDFVELGVLRSALFKAVKGAGQVGITHEHLTQKIFDSLTLPITLYAVNPDARFRARADTDQALRQVIGYRIYRDLKRGWRVTSPNLEQCGLLEIRYASLEEACRDEELWESRNAALANATPEDRARICKTLLDYMRRELAVRVDYLDRQAQERIKLVSGQHLIAPWAIDEQELLDYSKVLYPRSIRANDTRDSTFLSGRSGFGQYLRRRTTLPTQLARLSARETEKIIRELLDNLRVAGIVEAVDPGAGEEEPPGYQLAASAMHWLAGDGLKAFHDPIRMPNLPDPGIRTNRFFVEFYRSIAATAAGIEAKEHTAQVPYEKRIEREDKFREAKLPVLFCSPTMELGIDISELNLVHLRNVPPTPANYVQRSGRAGRSGQPALVTAYCATGNSHDQYFFKRPKEMVHGVVFPPRIDLANEDLIRAHLHAVWLATTGVQLGKSLKEVLEIEGEEPTLALLPSIRDSIEFAGAREKAITRARRVLASVEVELQKSDWYSDHWVDDVFTQAVHAFDATCERWRSLYRAARAQQHAQNKVILDASRSPQDRKEAERLRRESESQLKLLTESEGENLYQSDFYSYRYFASEGFLPGYNFPRLPLSAFIPGRKAVRGSDEFLARPRFLAISEFAPRSIVYHEGSRYIINKVILPVGTDDSLTSRAKRCPACGYLHVVVDGDGPDLCERCHVTLDQPLNNLFRMQNVSTKRRDRINSDEEVRRRVGYEIKTSYRFGEVDGHAVVRTAEVKVGNELFAGVSYGHAATLRRMNLGWSRRQNPNQLGFVLDWERGYWGTDRDLIEDDDEDPLGDRRERVIPFVEDRRNCLLFEPAKSLTISEMASLEAALKTAIQVRYQLEDNELATEVLPGDTDRKIILLYESAEGGAGVLRHLTDDTQAMGHVARQALEICHFNPDTGDDLRHAPGDREECMAACYDCLMTYGNQDDHRHLDRKSIVKLLLTLRDAHVLPSPKPLPRGEHLEALMKRADSELERKWLRFLESAKLLLPSRAQTLIETCRTRPDFIYDPKQTVIYVDGPPHDYPERQKRDQEQTECLLDHGYTVVRFKHSEDWLSMVKQYPHVFGSPS